MRTRRRLHALSIAIVAVAPSVWAKGKPAPKTQKTPPAASSSAEPQRAADEAPAEAQEGSGKPGKPKVYNFSGLDLEGRLKTPQLLYFLNRVRVELDSTNNAKRSFMKDLERSADDKGL